MSGELNTVTSARPFPLGFISRIISHLREPLFWNGYALIFGSMATSLLGIAYWGVAARTYSVDIVGTNTAAMSGMQLLSLLSQLGMVNVANRFVPTAGKATAKLVLVAYAIATLMALLTGLIFVAGINIWTPSLGFIQNNPILAVCFVASTMGWVVFVIQDAVLVGLRQATWVPIENVIYSVSKIGLLVLFVGLIPVYGIFASWVIPSIIILIPTNILIFKYLIPRHIVKAVANNKELTLRAVTRFVAGNYLSTLIWNATVSILPLIVFAIVGSEASAYFYLPWTIAFALHLVSINMNMSFLTEVAADSGKLASYSFRTWLQTMRLLVPAVIIIEIGAPLILQVFGGNYVASGVTLLRLLTLSTIGYSFTAHFMEISRARQRNRDAFLVQFILCFFILSLGYLFLRIWGVNGLGLAWFICNTLMGGYLAVTQLGKTWLPEIKRSQLARFVPLARFLYWRFTHRGIHSDALMLVPQILKQTAVQKSTPEFESWTRYTIIPTTTEMTVLSVGQPGKPAEGIIKIPQTLAAEKTLLKHREVLKALKGDSRIGDFVELLPVIIDEGSVDGRTYSFERMMPGVSGNTSHASAKNSTSAIMVAVEGIRKLHLRTLSSVHAGNDMVSMWVDGHIAVLEKLYHHSKSEFNGDQAIKRLHDELHAGLVGKHMRISWVHGDFWMGNIYFSLDGKTLTGILDWEQARPDEIPQCDLFLLLISSRMWNTGEEMGHIVNHLLANPDWSAQETEILDQGVLDFDIDPIETRTLLLLSWLKHVSGEIDKTMQLKSNWAWIDRNVEAVLREL